MDKKRLHKLLMSFKNQGGGNFNEILHEMNQSIKWFCSSRKYRWNLLLFEEDDIYQIMCMGILSGIESYKFYCRECNAKLDTKKNYIIHMCVEHGHKKVVINPRIAIEDWVLLHMYNEVKNELKKGSSKKRSTINNVLYNETQYESDSRVFFNSKDLQSLSLCVNIDYDSDIRVKQFLKYIKLNVDHKTLKILKSISKGSTKKDIAEKLVKKRRYLNINSALTAINISLKNECKISAKEYLI